VTLQKKQEFEEKVKEAVEKGYIENDQSKLNTLLEHAVLPGDIKALNSCRQMTRLGL